jgi:hypothetical protein
VRLTLVSRIAAGADPAKVQAALVWHAERP